MEIIQAVPVLGRYLASVKMNPKDLDEKKFWFEHHQGLKMFAPAWLSREWGLVSLGEPIYGTESVFTPIPSDVSLDQRDSLPAALFPQVIARDPLAEECPYLYGVPTQITCLGQDLQMERKKDGTPKRWDLQTQARGYLVHDGEVWIKTLISNTLLSKLDIATGKVFGDGVLSLAAVRKALKKTEVQEDDLQDLAPAGPAADDLTTASAYMDSLLKVPGSFQYDVAIKGSNVYVVLRRPLCFLVASWPDGKIQSVTQISSADLPAWAHSYNDVFLISIGVWQQEVIAWFSVARPLTYGHLLVTNPGHASTVQEQYQRRQEPLTAETILGIEENRFGISLTGRSVRAYELKLGQGDGDGWVATGVTIFHAGEKEVWTSAVNRKTRQFGVARLM